MLATVSLYANLGILTEDYVVAIILATVGEKKMRKSEAILRFISLNENGRKFTEVARFCCLMNGIDYDKKDTSPQPRPNGRRVNRGYYSTILCGSGRQVGLLPYNCDKINGRWVLKSHVKYCIRHGIKSTLNPKRK